MFADDPEEQRSGGAEGNTGIGAVKYPCTKQTVRPNNVTAKRVQGYRELD